MKTLAYALPLLAFCTLPTACAPALGPQADVGLSVERLTERAQTLSQTELERTIQTYEDALEASSTELMWLEGQLASALTEYHPKREFNHSATGLEADVRDLEGELVALREGLEVYRQALAELTGEGAAGQSAWERRGARATEAAALRE